MYSLLTILLSILTCVLLALKRSVPAAAVFNIYRQPGTFSGLKAAFMRAVLELRHATAKRCSAEELAAMEQPQKLSGHENAIDAVYFNGANSEGSAMVLGMARRPRGLVDGFLFLQVAALGEDVLCSPRLPSTALLQKPEEEGFFAADGLLVSVKEPMKVWSVRYSGPMTCHRQPDRVLQVELDAEFRSALPYFNYDVDMDSGAMAKAMAREPWNHDYFETMKRLHQTHYEQFGELAGTVVVDGRTLPFQLGCMRDHSFGERREWRNFHRYALHYLTLENGDRVAVGIVSMPMVFSWLPMGFYLKRGAKQASPVQECDLKLYEHGEDATPPSNYSFSFVAGGKKYLVSVQVRAAPEFFISKECESRIVECLCSFQVNGTPGWGAAEWQYRNIDGPDYAPLYSGVHSINKDK